MNAPSQLLHFRTEHARTRLAPGEFAAATSRKFRIVELQLVRMAYKFKVREISDLFAIHVPDAAELKAIEHLTEMRARRREPVLSHPTLWLEYRVPYHSFGEPRAQSESTS